MKKKYKVLPRNFNDQKVWIRDQQTTFDSIEDAESKIEELLNKDQYKYYTFTIKIIYQKD